MTRPVRSGGVMGPIVAAVLYALIIGNGLYMAFTLRRT